MYDREKIMKTLTEIKDESQTIAPYVIVAQPRRNKQETPAQSFDGHGLTHIDVMGYSHGFVDIDGEKVDVARNYLIDACLSVPEAKYMFFIGEDTVVPWDAFTKLHETAEANPRSIITGVYYMKMSNAMIMVRDQNIIKIPDISPEPRKIIEAWQTGMDCMLIPLDILREIQEKEPDIPWTCIANELQGFPFVGEDNFFVHRMHKHGVKILVDTAVQCLHMDIATGKYTAWEGVDLNDYYTNIQPTERLTLKDKKFMDKRWLTRIPGGDYNLEGQIAAQIEKKLPVKLNMGSGRDKFEGYLNIDKSTPEADLHLDITTTDLPENTVDEILASHILEHLIHIQVIDVLMKWYKGLKPGGKLIIEMPNALEMARHIDDNPTEYLTAIFGISANNVTPQTLKDGESSTHLWGWGPETLVPHLENIGYTNIRVEKPKGLHPGINFRIEATKPKVKASK